MTSKNYSKSEWQTLFSYRTKALHMIFDQLIFNIENIMLLLIILPFIFTKVSKNVKSRVLELTVWYVVKYFKLNHNNFAINRLLVYHDTALHHTQLIFESDIMYRLFTISGIKVLVSKKKRFLFRKINVFYNNFKFYFISFCKLSPFLQQQKLCLSVADPMLWRSTFY